MLDAKAIQAAGLGRFSSPFFQAAWVVSDLNAAVERWSRTFGVGPFYVFDHVQLDGLQYRGNAARLDMSAALAQAGDLQIELICQHCDQPSPYRDAFAAGQEGFHHLAVFTDEYDRDLASYTDRGFAVVGQGAVGPMRFAYVDTMPVMGFMVEVMEDNEPFRDAFRQITEAARGWDGERPVRGAADLGF